MEKIKQEWESFIEKLLEQQMQELYQLNSTEYGAIHDNEAYRNWHKQSLKQFIDELIEVQNEHMQKELSVERFARPDFYKGYEASKNETISNLKKLKEELN